MHDLCYGASPDIKMLATGNWSCYLSFSVSVFASLSRHLIHETSVLRLVRSWMQDPCRGASSARTSRCWRPAAGLAIFYLCRYLSRPHSHETTVFRLVRSWMHDPCCGASSARTSRCWRPAAGLAISHSLSLSLPLSLTISFMKLLFSG